MARTPHFRRIADQIRSQIERGELRPGDPLPTSAELRERYDVAAATIQAAITELTRAGLVTGERFRGRYVADRPMVQRLARNRLAASERDAGRGAFLTDAAAGGWSPSVETTVSYEAADSELEALLETRSTLVRDRVMSADGHPTMLATSYLPAALVAGTAIEAIDPGPGGIYARLEDLGCPLTSYTETVTGRAALDSEAERLEIATGRSVLLVARYAYSGDRIVEVNRMVMPADRYQLVYSWPAE